MPQETFRLSPRGVLLASIAAAFPLATQAAPVARVDFAVGNVMAVAPSGQTRPLAKGAQVEEGETVNTNTGRAQLRFVDGAYVSLQPESEFRIDQYRYAGREDGSENAVLSLFKGGLRTITGFIGRTNKRNYQVTTTVATIGIRGTEYTIQYGESIRGTVGDGEIEVCNGAGCLDVKDGETYYVANQDTQPVLTNKGTDLPPAPPESPPQKFAENENVNEEGELCTLFPETCVLTPSGLTGTLTVNLAFAYSDGGADYGTTTTTATLDASGRLTSIDGGRISQSIEGPYSDVGNDGIIAWGRAFIDVVGEFGGGVPFHYALGTPVPNPDSLGDKIGTYTLMTNGATKPTGANSGADAIFVLTSATLNAGFYNGSLSGTLGWSNSLSASFSGSISGQTFNASGQTGSVGFVDVAGFFAGTDAARAGLVYYVEDFGFLNEPYIGAAALTQTNLIVE